MSAPLLAYHNVHAAYGRIQALRGIHIEVHAGEIVTLIGANGAGKSTTMMTLFGRPRAHIGHIIFDGQDITQIETHHVASLGIAQSPEGRRIFPRMSVMENLKMGSPPSASDFDGNLARVLDLFPRLKERLSQRGGTLSGGEQQMLAIGRALMSRPRLLLLDEPFIGVAPLIIRDVREALAKIAAEGITILLVEQNIHRALEFVDRAYVIENGRTILQGTREQLLDDKSFGAKMLGLD